VQSMSGSPGGGGGDRNGHWLSAEDLAVEAAQDQGLWSSSHSLASEFTPVAPSSLLQESNGMIPPTPLGMVGSTDALKSVYAGVLGSEVGARPAPLRAGDYSLGDVLGAFADSGFGDLPRKEVVRLLWSACRLRVGHEGELLKRARQVDVAFLLEILHAKREKVRFGCEAKDKKMF